MNDDVGIPLPENDISPGPMPPLSEAAVNKNPKTGDGADFPGTDAVQEGGNAASSSVRPPIALIIPRREHARRETHAYDIVRILSGPLYFPHPDRYFRNHPLKYRHRIWKRHRR